MIEGLDKVSKYIAEKYVKAESNNIYNLTEEEKNNYKNSKKCYVCNKKLNKIPDLLKLELDKKD